MIKVFLSILSVLSILLSSGYQLENPLTQKGEFLQTVFHKKDIIAETHKGIESDYIWSADEVFTSDSAKTVYKEEGKEFKILNVADIHFSDFGYRIGTGIGAEAVLRALVKETKPDLITLSGDIVCGDSSYYSVRRITDLMEEFGIPWAPVFGNHDDEANCDLNYLSDVMMSGKHCLMSKGDKRMGVGNYIINIAEKDSAGERVVETLVMMDSHHSQPNEIQTEWVKWAAEGIKNLSGGTSQLSLFMHIPLPEYEFAYNELCVKGKWIETASGHGSKHEKICCERNENGPVQRGFFDVLKSLGNVKFVFCSHDHMNDYSVLYQGIRLTYMMKIGKASGYQPGFDGATVITVDNSGVKSINHKVLGLFGFKDEEMFTV